MTHLQTVIDRIKEVANDDYEGQQAPSEKTVKKAIAFLKKVGSCPLGFASSAGAGDIRLYWRTEKNFVHLTFDEAGIDLWSQINGKEEFLRRAKPIDFTRVMIEFVCERRVFRDQPGH